MHAAQFRAGQAGATTGTRADLEGEAAAGADALLRGWAFAVGLGAPAGMDLYFPPPDAVTGAAPAASTGPAAPIVIDAAAFGRLREVTVPGETEPRLMSEGQPADPQILVALLVAAIGDATRPWLDRLVIADKSSLSVMEVLRLGDRASWVQARILWESTDVDLLASIRLALSDRDLGAVVPYLRGVVPAEELIRIWDGWFSSDVEGVIRILDRMPDEEVLGLIQDYQTAGRLSGTSAGTLAGAVDRVLSGEHDGGYRALRTLAARVQRAGSAMSQDVAPEARQAAGNLAHELRVRAAFVRIEEADRRRRADLAYLAVADLDPVERYVLDSSYLSSWRPEHLSLGERSILNILVASNADIDVAMRALDVSKQEADRHGEPENQVGLEVAGQAIESGLTRLAERARDSTLPEADRQAAADELESRGRDDRLVDRLLDLPHGQRMITQGLGLARSRLSRALVLRATSPEQLMEALQGLHPFDIDRILGAPEVTEHLAAVGLQVSDPMRRVLGAYATVSGSVPDSGFPATSAMWLPPVPGLPSAGAPAATLSLTGPLNGFDVTPGGTGPDPVVVVAAYRVYQAAKSGDLAGVLSPVRALRPSQRAQLGDESYFTAALSTLRASRWDATPRIVADTIADPRADLSRAADALLAAGLQGEPGYAFDVRDPRLLAEGLAVPAGDRRLLRYRYVLDALQAEQRTAGITDLSSQQTDLRMRGVPAELEIGSGLDQAYRDRMYALDRLDPVPRLKAEETFLGEPEFLRENLSPQEAALEAEFMRIRLSQQLAAAASGIDASGVFGWSPETLTELSAEFDRTWDRLGAGGTWTRDSLIQLAAAYHDAMDAVERNRRERNNVAEFVGTLAAVVAGVVTIIATAGTATPAVASMLAAAGAEAGTEAAVAGVATAVAAGEAGTPLVASVLTAAGLGAGADAAVAARFRDYTSPDQALADVGHGAVTGALTVVGEALAKPAGAIIGRAMVRDVAIGAIDRAMLWTARAAVEGAISGAVQGAGDAVFATAIDRSTWEHGVLAVFARFLSAAIRGAFAGGVAGAVLSPVLGAGVAGAGRVLTAIGRSLGVTGAGLSAALRRIGALADEGRFDMALREMDRLELSGLQRDQLTQELYRRALGSTREGAVVPERVLRELEHARQVTRGLDYEAGEAGAGERPRLDVRPVEDLLSRLEPELGPGAAAHVRKIIYGEIRLPPERLIVAQHAFETGLQRALDDLVPSSERALLPPYEVRVLPEEAFQGMFREQRGGAVTLVEGDRAVVYASAEADVRTYMLQEAAHVRQLADPALAADARMLAEHNVLDWAGKSAEDRLHLLDLQRRLEIDAQKRIIEALQGDEPFTADPQLQEELTHAQERLDELQQHQAEAEAITPEELAEINAGLRRRPTWMEDEARLFGREVAEARPAATEEELVASARPVTNSRTVQAGEHAVQLGKGWTKVTTVTSGIRGKVTAISTVKGTTEVTVTPSSGGEPRVYQLERGGTAAPGVAVGSDVAQGDALGSWSQQYRLVEIQRGTTAVRRVEEILDAKGRWVERGSARTTRGEVLEEATQRQVTAELDQLKASTGTGATLRDWFMVPRGTERWGFDRVFVEFHGEGEQMTALIRVLEVKDYPNSYVPLAEFTAITDNLGTNLQDLYKVLRGRVDDLAAAGRQDAARALHAALDAQDVQVEIWLGPTTEMGINEASKRSVLARLRASIDAQPGNIRLASGGPKYVTEAYQQEAVAARKAAL